MSLEYTTVKNGTKYNIKIVRTNKSVSDITKTVDIMDSFTALLESYDGKIERGYIHFGEAVITFERAVINPYPPIMC